MAAAGRSGDTAFVSHKIFRKRRDASPPTAVQDDFFFA
jgi:hypothetical protein